MAELQQQKVFSENARGQAEWGQFYFATAMVRLLWKYIRSIVTYMRSERRGHLCCWSC
jgi:hypothetical protein